jgi:hypothetical protein
MEITYISFGCDAGLIIRLKVRCSEERRVETILSADAWASQRREDSFAIVSQAYQGDPDHELIAHPQAYPSKRLSSQSKSYVEFF